MMNEGHIIRIAQMQNLEEIIYIYNCAVHSKFETADTLPVKWRNRMGRFNNHNPEKYPIFVYEVNEQVAGWIGLSPYRKGRKALKFTIEISYYVHPQYRHKGVGNHLINYAIEKGRELKYRTLVAIILDKNEKSISLVSKFGFKKWGHLPNIADFDQTECGHVYYGLRIGNPKG
ncbi:MAG: N-acetyltransferase [Niastella sp.]|nr:N-acetyltransferase [Niastella sp.]